MGGRGGEAGWPGAADPARRCECGRVPWGLAGLLVGLWACGPLSGGGYRGEPLATVRGTVEVAPGRGAPSTVRLALGWYASLAPDTLGPLCAVTEAPELAREPYPAHYELSAFAPPPAEALGDLASQGGEGRGATGVVLAYVDADGSGTFTAEGPLADALQGASLRPATATAHSAGWRLVYVDGTPPSSPPGLARGFNLVSTEAGVAPFASAVPVVLDGAPALSPLRCVREACVQQLPKPQLKLVGSLGVADGTSAASFTLEDAQGSVSTATVTVNQRVLPYDGAKRRYSAVDMTHPFVLPGVANQVTVRADGYADLDAQVALPAAVQLQTPAFNAVLPRATAFSVGWSASAGAQKYLLRVFDGTASKTLFQVQTTELTYLVPALDFTGAANVNVEAEGATVEPPAGSFIFPYTNAGRPVQLQ